jgi:hypothetical protein
MLEKNYSFLSTKEKEDYILQTTLSLSKFYISANTFLEYLILEYNISEECYTKIAHPNGNKAVDDMFNTRRLNQELNKELPINSGTTTRIKV